MHHRREHRRHIHVQKRSLSLQRTFRVHPRSSRFWGRVERGGGGGFNRLLHATAPILITKNLAFLFFCFPPITDWIRFSITRTTVCFPFKCL
ncbi:hypothetical protein IE53DRAFT_214790 [Violaceomyces palustris]|uniref:Uncharacterized protein n=1 Tax=Violaceomyces palustris TaxID=1673888 RepID=A0ACD0NQG6_9BASI|nr:hypothetical protein IE53DRAFT_214790 [Violaceomyces palustris]